MQARCLRYEKGICFSGPKRPIYQRGLKLDSEHVDNITEQIVWTRFVRTLLHDTRLILFISTAGNFAVGPTTAGEADPADGARCAHPMGESVQAAA